MPASYLRLLPVLVLTFSFCFAAIHTANSNIVDLRIPSVCDLNAITIPPTAQPMSYCGGGATDVTPDSYTVTLGSYVSGGIVELATSDDADLKIRRAAISLQAKMEFEAKAVSPVAVPTLLSVTLEGSAFSGGPVNQIIELYDYDADSWEIVDIQAASLVGDITVTATPSGDVSRFVQPGTNCIEAKIRYHGITGSSRRKRFASRTDHFFWTIE